MLGSSAGVVLMVGNLAGRSATPEMQGVDDVSVDLIDAHSDGAADVGSSTALETGDVSQGDDALR